MGAAASGRAFRRVRTLAWNTLLLVVVDVIGAGAGAGEGEAAPKSPQITPAWDAAMLAARMRSARAGAGMVGMATADDYGDLGYF